MRRWIDPDAYYDDMRQRLLDAQSFPDVTFVEESHEYFINGARVPSVTEVLKPIQTVGGSEETRDFKRQIGKALDTAITLNEFNDLDFSTLDEAVWPFFQAWLKFKEETGFRVLLNQVIVYSLKLRFAGTLDMVGTRDGSNNPDELVDTKCVWKIDPATAIQTAGYDLALRESHGIRVAKRGGVQLLRDGTYRYHEYRDPADENVFKACLSVFSWRKLRGV